MTPKEIKKLTQLLKKLRSDDLLPPNTPFEVWSQLQTILPAPAVEIILTNSNKAFLLTYRKDNYWDDWHIPGGFMVAKETVSQACKRIAKRELGISVRLEKIENIFTWKNHPYANAMSIICFCKPLGKPKDGKFFTKIPKNTIPQHKKYLKKVL